MILRTKEYNVGVDVSKQKLDISSAPEHAMSIDNNPKGFEQFVKKLEQPLLARVVMEATGGYEKPFATFLQEQGIAVSIVNPKRVRDFAKAVGQLAKTDNLDAHIIRQFADTVKPMVMPQVTEKQQVLEALTNRRNQLVKQRSMEKQHLETAYRPEARESIERIIKLLDEEIEHIELTTYQIFKATENLGSGRLFCKHLFKYRSPRVNQETVLRLSFLKLQCCGSLCSFVFFPRAWDDGWRYPAQYGHTNALPTT